MLEEAVAALDSAQLYRPNLPIAGPEHRAFRAADLKPIQIPNVRIKATLYRSDSEALLRHALDPTGEPPERAPNAGDPSPVYARWLEECVPWPRNVKLVADRVQSNILGQIRPSLVDVDVPHQR